MQSITEQDTTKYLNEILEIISAQYFLICDEWINHFRVLNNEKEIYTGILSKVVGCFCCTINSLESILEYE